MKTTCAMMQPHFFPWGGYFNLISKVDKFIFLDDAQYSKSSWQSRNKVIISNEVKWITVHTLKSSTKKTIILDKKIDRKKNWKIKLIKSLEQNYSKHPYFRDLRYLLEYFSKLESVNLADLNIKLIKFICNEMGIKTNFVSSSKFQIKKKRSNKIIDIIEKLNISEYLTVPGAEHYLAEDQFLKKTSINLVINIFNQNKYNQYNQKDFVKNLSIIDILANLGWLETSKYVKKNYD